MLSRYGLQPQPWPPRSCCIGTRKMGDMGDMGDMGVVDVEAGHAIAVLARHRVMQNHRVLNVMTHVDPWKARDPD